MPHRKQRTWCSNPSEWIIQTEIYVNIFLEINLFNYFNQSAVFPLCSEFPFTGAPKSTHMNIFIYITHAWKTCHHGNMTIHTNPLSLSIIFFLLLMSTLRRRNRRSREVRDSMPQIAEIACSTYSPPVAWPWSSTADSSVSRPSWRPVQPKRFRKNAVNINKPIRRNRSHFIKVKIWTKLKLVGFTIVRSY